MMAIQSAIYLSSSLGSASARSTTWMQNPGSFKLPGRGKRQLRLRNLKAYADPVCDETIYKKYGGRSGLQRVGSISHIQGSHFEASAPQCGSPGKEGVEGGGRERERKHNRVHTIVHRSDFCSRPQESSVSTSLPPNTTPSTLSQGTRNFTATTAVTK